MFDWQESFNVPEKSAMNRRVPVNEFLITDPRGLDIFKQIFENTDTCNLQILIRVLKSAYSHSRPAL